MIFLYLDKIPLFILGIGLLTSLHFWQFRFRLAKISLYLFQHYPCWYFIHLSGVSSWNKYRVFLAMLITVSFVVMLPVIKMHFAY
nr:Uncharacterised protein [Klebsiella pneumoniae]